MSGFSEIFKNAKGQVVQALHHDQLIASTEAVTKKVNTFLDELYQNHPDLEHHIDINVIDKTAGKAPDKLARKTDYVKLTISSPDIFFAHPNAAGDHNDFHSALDKMGIKVITSDEKSKVYRGITQDHTIRYKLAVPTDDNNPENHHVIQLEVKQEKITPKWTTKDEVKVDKFYRASQTQVSTSAKIARALCEDLSVDYYNNESCLIADPKSPRRVKEKAITEYDGDITKIKDGTRLMILFDDGKTVDDIRKSLKSTKSCLNQYLSKKDYEIFEEKDLFDTPKELGYMAYFLWIRPKDAKDNNGSIEIQLTHKDLQNHYNPRTHDIYEEHRPQIEAYRQANVPISQWDETTRNAAYEIRQIHFEGAQKTGIINYVKNWPYNENDQVERYQEDIPQLIYRPISYQDLSADYAKNVKEYDDTDDDDHDFYETTVLSNQGNDHNHQDIEP